LFRSALYAGPFGRADAAHLRQNRLGGLKALGSQLERATEDFDGQRWVGSEGSIQIGAINAQSAAILASPNLEQRVLVIQQRGPAERLARSKCLNTNSIISRAHLNANGSLKQQVEVAGLFVRGENGFVFPKSYFCRQRDQLLRLSIRKASQETVFFHYIG